MTQMEQWSILSNILNYVQHSKFNSMNHTLNVRPVNRYKIQIRYRKRIQGARLWYSSTEFTGRIFRPVYEGIQSDVVSSSRFDENSDISATYLGKIEQQGKYKIN